MAPTLIEQVERFWDANPLFAGEFECKDTTQFFDRHDAVYATDVFSGIDFERVFSLPGPNQRVLDLGCGTGYWLAFFKNKLGIVDLTGVDLSRESLKLAKARVGSGCRLRHGNAEHLGFEDEEFDHVNCQGVVHHTPDTQKAVAEIYRVLRRGGTASISVYYDNLGLRLFSICRPLVRAFYSLLGKNLGRGRDFSRVSSKEDLVRLYDGDGNPVGKSYNRAQFQALLAKVGFSNIRFSYFFFPFRFFRVPVPPLFRRSIVWICPFMIVANCTRPE